MVYTKIQLPAQINSPSPEKQHFFHSVLENKNTIHTSEKGQRFFQPQLLGDTNKVAVGTQSIRLNKPSWVPVIYSQNTQCVPLII